ncbi:MAG: hypothetical protein ACYTF0_03000, partial [Planctomycetota bacterium]
MKRRQHRKGHRESEAEGGQQRERKSRGPSRGPSRGQSRGSKRPSWLVPTQVLEVLAAAAEPLGASGVARELGIGGQAVRDVAKLLRALADGHQVIEVRPGRFSAVGSGGEFPVTVVDGEGGPAARFPDQRILPIHPNHRFGAEVGDRAVALVNGDDQALIVRLVERFGRQLVGGLNFAR